MNKLMSQAAEICSHLQLSEPAFLGAGAYKECYRANKKNGTTVAVKVFDPDKCNRWRASREIEAMQKCDFPHIAKVIDWVEEECSDGKQYLAIVEEFLNGGNLTALLNSGTVSCDQAFGYVVPLVHSLDHLRLLRLVHRDIKPDNIMFREASKEPVLVDFGIVRDLTGESLTRSYLQRGPCTPYFASPEQLNNEKHLIDWRSDQFSLGVVLSICIKGRHPYQPCDDSRQLMAVDEVASRRSCSKWLLNACQEDDSMNIIKRMVSPWSVNRFTSPADLIKEIDSIRR